MPLNRRLDRCNPLFGIPATEEENPVVDAGVFVRARGARQTDRRLELRARFKGLPQPLERQPKQAMGLCVVARSYGPPQYLDGMLKPVEEVQRPAVIEARVLQRRLAFTGVTERHLGTFQVAFRRVDHPKG